MNMMKTKYLHKIVSPVKRPDELYMVIGLQLDIDSNENVLMIINNEKITKSINFSEVIIQKDKTVEDVFRVVHEDSKFCYRCLMHVKPISSLRPSEYYSDIDNKPIIGLFPECPVCHGELLMRGYYTAAEDFKNFHRIKKEHFSYEVS